MFWGGSGVILLTVLLCISENVFAFAAAGSLRARHLVRTYNGSKVVDKDKVEEKGNATAEQEEDDDGVEVSWSPTVALVQKSLEDVEAQRSQVQEKLRLLRKSCDFQVAACDQEVEETAANLRRLTIAVAQLRQMRENDVEKVEENEKKRAVQEATVERDISDLVALQQFARLSKEDVDVQRKKYHELSVAYGTKIDDAQKAIVKAQAKLDEAREQERAADGSAVFFTSDAMAISDGVNATDAFAEEEVMEAQRKEHSASALFKKAQSMATRAASMLRYHRARTASVDDEDYSQDEDPNPLTQSEEVEGISSVKEEPCPPHHSEAGESFIQKPCVPRSSQAKDDFINEAEAAAQRARAATMKEEDLDDADAEDED
jgi:hypothetical protein